MQNLVQCDYIQFNYSLLYKTGDCLHISNYVQHLPPLEKTHHYNYPDFHIWLSFIYYNIKFNPCSLNKILKIIYIFEKGAQMKKRNRNFISKFL